MQSRPIFPPPPACPSPLIPLPFARKLRLGPCRGLLFGPVARYYKDVRPCRLLPFALLLPLTFAPLTLLSGCDRGAHPAQTGKVAPDFTVSDGTTSIHLANYRGRVVLLNFWASWCQPCIAELPSLLELQHEQPSLAVLAVSIDEDSDAYKRFLIRRHVDLITVRDPDQTAAKLYRTDMWPETYVIDRQGVIRRKFIGAQDWSSPEVRAYLKNL